MLRGFFAERRAAQRSPGATTIPTGEAVELPGLPTEDPTVP
jgi:hypothetical protein